MKPLLDKYTKDTYEDDASQISLTKSWEWHEGVKPMVIKS